MQTARARSRKGSIQQPPRERAFGSRLWEHPQTRVRLCPAGAVKPICPLECEGMLLVGLSGQPQAAFCDFLVQGPLGCFSHDRSNLLFLLGEPPETLCAIPT